MTAYFNFEYAIDDVKARLIDGDLIDANQWQSIKIPDSVKFIETTNVSFTVDLSDERDDLKFWANDIEPNLPWADVAFQERVAGIPWNPGIAWESWPYARSAASFKQEMFSHSYAERYWPKFAGKRSDKTWKERKGFNNPEVLLPNSGIRFKYGDLRDIVSLFNRDPLTRQAYLPVFFPEDTGAVHGERIPCTLGYHFLHRYGEMDITYYIRSCDFVRHFRDDLYMTLRLLIWMGEHVNFPIRLGTFTFHCVSMHCFEQDIAKL